MPKWPSLGTSTQIPSPAARQEHSVPAGLLFPLVQVVKHWNVAADDLLGVFGLREQDLAEPQTRFPHDVYIAIVARARALTAEPGLGIGWGLQMRVSTFGFLGFATMSAATLRDALNLVIGFGPLGSTSELLHLHEEEGVASLVFEEHADFGAVRDVLTMARLVGLWRMAEMMTGRDIEGTAEIGYPEPSYHARFAHMLPRVRYDRPVTRAILRTEILEFPLVDANPISLRIATEQCRRDLHAMSSGGRLIRTVRSLLWKPEGGFRSPLEVARAVRISPRTLRRNLTHQGTSLSSLFDEERRERALLLLRVPELSLAEVAERLGYRNVQNFERAFRRWTGATPAAYRRS